jgi:hypothetical protein
MLWATSPEPSAIEFCQGFFARFTFVGEDVEEDNEPLSIHSSFSITEPSAGDQMVRAFLAFGCGLNEEATS